MVDNNIEENLDKVLYLDKKERKEETFTTALRNRLEEMKEVGATGYTRELVISVPKDIIDTNSEARKFVKLAGSISRDKEVNIPVKMEPTKVPTADKTILLLDFVFSVTESSLVDKAIEKYL